ncbi:MAG: hypothetical protein AAGG72_01820 [Pseudomonadota bacterium]
MTEATNSKPKSKRGGARPGAGRPKGPRSAHLRVVQASEEQAAKERLARLTSQELRQKAQELAETAMQTLHQVMVGGETEGARITAAKEILDRAVGKSTQPIEDDTGTQAHEDRLTELEKAAAS